MRGDAPLSSTPNSDDTSPSQAASRSVRRACPRFFRRRCERFALLLLLVVAGAEEKGSTHKSEIELELIGTLPSWCR